MTRTALRVRALRIRAELRTPASRGRRGSPSTTKRGDMARLRHGRPLSDPASWGPRGCGVLARAQNREVALRARGSEGPPAPGAGRAAGPARLSQARPHSTAFGKDARRRRGDRREGSVSVVAEPGACSHSALHETGQAAGDSRTAAAGSVTRGVGGHLPGSATLRETAAGRRGVNDMNTRTIAIAALVIAVIILVILLF